VAGGAANQIHYQTGAGATSFITAPTVSSTYLQWTGTAFAWTTSITSAGGSNTQVQYNSSGSLAGSANMVFDGTTITSAFSGPHNGTVGATTASTGAFTTLSASSTVSGAGFSNYLASPPAIGGTTAAAGSFTNLAYTGTLTGGTGVVNLGSGQFYKDASGNVGIGVSSPASQLHINKATGANALTVGNISNGAIYGCTSSGNPILGSYAGAQNIQFGYFSSGISTSFTEYGRFDTSGNLLVSTTSNVLGGTASHVAVVYNGGTQWGIALKDGSNNSSNVAIAFVNTANSVVGYIQATNTATTYNTSSDYRLKENVEPMQNALNVIQQLKPVTYKWKSDGSNGQGFIAHELEAVVPDCVTGEKDAVDADGKPVYQGIDTSFLVATLTAAIQELNAKVDAQAAEIKALKGVA
jgi:hypothetical protein